MVCHWSFKHICDLYEFWLYGGATLARSLDFDTCSLNHLRNQYTESMYCFGYCMLDGLWGLCGHRDFVLMFENEHTV